MDAEETSGGNIETLYTDGPYARSRNPQYVGMIVGLTGFALIVNALSVAILAALHVLWVVLLPFAQEPWLREQFGAAYNRYRERVPRFIGRRTFRRMR
jgi:protein-S-isoprenylcysteine O-methyltransferase Ste14